MKNYIYASLLGFAALVAAPAATADGLPSDKYVRSSIYSILINHTDQTYGEEIHDQFLNIPVPDQFNDHNLSVKVVKVTDKLKGDKLQDSIKCFIENNYIASRLVARWFERDIFTGQCSMELIKERGVYNASAFDYELSQRSQRGIAMLQDAGEELIGSTYLLVNDITYHDKQKTSQAVGTGIRVAGALASAFLGSAVSDLADDIADMAETIKGFKVSIHTYLYRLVWDDDIAAVFYKDYYSATGDEAKMQAFENNRGSYKLEYVGDVDSKGSTTSFMGINEDQPLLMIRKACQRAIDKNVADLQIKYEDFRVKSPIVGVDPEVKVQIGLKEGITPDTKFEVLEMQQGEDGRITYKKVGEVKPIAGKIWDNRFMAIEEEAYGADLGATSFTVVSGKDFYPGMLIRRID